MAPFDPTRALTVASAAVGRRPHELFERMRKLTFDFFSWARVLTVEVDVSPAQT